MAPQRSTCPIACGAVVLAALAASPARAQRANENVVTASTYAFGTTVGSEHTGLYVDSDVRGFSALTAGNLRVDGVYFDVEGSLPSPLVKSSTIRVGLTALGYPFPAPTGIVDYSLRIAPPRPIVSMLAGVNSRGAYSVEVDAQRPIEPAHVGVSLGLNYVHDERFFGNHADIYSAALTGRWRPSSSLEVTPFAAWSESGEEEAPPVIFGSGAALPPRIRRRVFFGQTWAINRNETQQFGVLLNAAIGAGFLARGGLGYSVFTDHTRFADLFEGVGPSGVAAQHVLVAYPQQQVGSFSGELLLTRPLASSQSAMLLARFRDKSTDYGGAGAFFAPGPATIGAPAPLPRPDFQLGPRSHDHFRQQTLGAGYEGKFLSRLIVTGGVQWAHYTKSVQTPGNVPDETEKTLPLMNVAVDYRVKGPLSLFAGYTRGLEDAGTAPDNAANRNAALPAIVSTQTEADLRYDLGGRLQVIAGAFSIEKPYFAVDEHNLYSIVGTERHRGVELSVSGRPIPRLDIVVGAALMRPRVIPGTDAPAGLGPRPIGPADATLTVSADYRSRLVPRLSFDGTLLYAGRRAASSDNRLMIPPTATLNLGARYRFDIDGKPASLRFTVTNLTNSFAWRPATNGAMTYSEPFRLLASITVDY